MDRLVAVLLCLVGLSAAADHPYRYETKFVDVRVDHFNFGTDDTFKLRYVINDTWWKPEEGAPIFFYTGNEGEVFTFADNTGLLWDLAPEFNALVVFAEHRYYGVSKPYGEKSFESPEYWGYLSSSQAMADYVDVLEHIRSEYGLPKWYNPVITFGGSYGAILAAWFRMKYPHEAIGALAASAPIWEFPGMTPCSGPNKVVSGVFNDSSPYCHDGIKASWRIIDDLAQDDEGMARLTEVFKLCKPLQDAGDVEQLKGWLSTVYVNLAMVNYPMPNNLLTDLPGYPVKSFCSHMGPYQSDWELMEQLSAGAAVFYNTTGKADCLDAANPNGDVGDKAWDIQCCTELVMPSCSDESTMFEPSAWDFDSYSDSCYSRYGVRPQFELVRKLYGGMDIFAASNIIFSNGLIDPWSAGGIMEDISDSVVAVVMPGVAHHLDLRPADPLDPPVVIQARNYYKKLFNQWISEHRQQFNRIQTFPQ